MNHETFIDEALALAMRGRGWVSPNPMVGALVVKNNKIIGRGWHKQFGGPHAEVFALEEAGAEARGATLYCTLEPCSHTGKTPPCTQAVIKAGIAEVVLGASDPNPLAAGGTEALRAAGVRVITGIREQACRKINAAFFKHTQTGLPLVTLKWAMSADGKIATANGDSKWITGEIAREHSHRLRAENDAVLIGIGTLLADDSKLNCRCAPIDGREARQPRRVILDSSARLPESAAIWTTPGGPIIVVCSQNALADRIKKLKEKGAEILVIDAESGPIPVEQILKELGKKQIQSLLVEGGSRVLGSFVDAKHADRACVFIAPLIIGGSHSVTAVGGQGAELVSKGLEISHPQIRMLGSDSLMTGSLSTWGE